MRESLAPLNKNAFVEWLTYEGRSRYHDHHPFHTLMHEGKLSRAQLQQWVLNRYYYQTRIPIKDALILSKSEDPGFRRMWIHRISDHDGIGDDRGGLGRWLHLAVAVGLDQKEVANCSAVLPGVRRACDSYVQLVRELPLTEAVALSLTELFAADIMMTRISAWERHYPWVPPTAFQYFSMRVSHARSDSREALDYVIDTATTYRMQEQCVKALIKKTEILWSLLDCLHAAFIHSKERTTPGA